MKSLVVVIFRRQMSFALGVAVDFCPLWQVMVGLFIAASIIGTVDHGVQRAGRGTQNRKMMAERLFARHAGSNFRPAQDAGMDGWSSELVSTGCFWAVFTISNTDVLG